MSRIAYVNGQFVPHREARIHIEDRGNQFADAVYEVWGVKDGALMDFDGHITRLHRSLSELRIASPMSDSALTAILHRMVTLNHVRNGLVYLQVSRGQARRDHAFPKRPVSPGVMITAKSIDMAKADKRAADGIAVITRPDIRWRRRDIKTVSLLPNVLAKQEAVKSGAAECWMVDEAGLVTEATASNAWIVTPEGQLVTRPADHDILNGITRRAIFALAKAAGLKAEERAFSVEEARGAREAFITSASMFLTPVVSIDGQSVGNGHPGSFSLQLRESYVATAKDRSRKRVARPRTWLVARGREHAQN
mgnify:CR=1 FL=1